jgi:hypothetical protein
MTQVRLKHQGRGRLALDLRQGPSRETMDQTGTKWSQPERAVRFGSSVLRAPQACPAILSIASAVLPAVFTATLLTGVETSHGVPEAIRGSEEVRRSIRNPNTDWPARSAVSLDAKELTGAAVQPLATNVPDQLAISGARSNLIKCVAAAIGEGAKVVAALLALLALAAASGAAAGQH